MNVQSRYECDAWLRTLDFVRQENSHLKNRLADIIQAKINQSVLEQAEDFQNNFIDKDTVIMLLKNEITEHEKLLATNVPDSTRTKQLMDAQKKLRTDMEQLEQEFTRLKQRFNNYIDAISRGMVA